MNYIDTIAREIYAITEGPGEPGPFDRILYRMYALLALSKGEGTTLEDVHDAWAAWCSEERPGHRSLVPFDQLAPDVQALDQPYLDDIHIVARRLRKEAA